MTRRLLILLVLTTGAFAQVRPLRMTAGAARVLPFETGGSRIASVISVRIDPPLDFPPLVKLDVSGGIRLIVPPATPRGTYNLRLRALTEDGRDITSAVTLTVDAVSVTPSSSGKTPVVLMNGFQLSCSGEDSSLGPTGAAGTFGQLPAMLQSDQIPVVFFNNCAYGQGVAIETLAAQLAAYLSSLTYADGTPVTQVDLVAHSLGGLIARAYLAGLQGDGSLSPPLNPGIRKLILLASPNFGSYLIASLATNPLAASLLSAQTVEMTPGSAFLWNLATWNQGQDDLRGVDALAVVGNAGPVLQPNQGDGVVSLTSASLGFARTNQRTRIVPYCHVTPSFVTSLAGDTCSAQGIVDIDSPAHLSSQIVRSFLADTTAWQSIGTTPGSDPVLSQAGGLFFSAVQQNDSSITDLTQATFGKTALTAGGSAGAVFYNDFVTGTATLQSASTSLGTINCGSLTEPAGFYTPFRCKLGPAISSISPLVLNSSARVIRSGQAITITGTGFGSQCSLCGVVMNPGSIALAVSSWSDQSISATLPPYSGLAAIVVRALIGSDSMKIFASAPAGSVTIGSVTNAASSAQGAIAPEEIIAIKGSGLGPATGVQFTVNAAGTIDTTLAGTRVFFGGIPAAVTYASAAQVNLVVPEEIAGLTEVTMQVSYQGNLSAGTTLAVAPASPAAFTFNSTGSGNAVAANQDNSFNGPTNPAAKGSYVTVYFTGGGATSPAGTTGGVNGSTLKYTQIPTVTVGGVAATPTFYGAAPGLVDGVYQLDIQLSPNTPSGPAEPLVITIANVSSPPNATLAVQ